MQQKLLSDWGPVGGSFLLKIFSLKHTCCLKDGSAVNWRCGTQHNHHGAGE